MALELKSVMPDRSNTLTYIENPPIILNIIVTLGETQPNNVIPLLLAAIIS